MRVPARMRVAGWLGMAGRQRGSLEPPFMGEDRAAVASEFGMAFLKDLTLLRGAPQRGEVFPVPLVGPAPRLRHCFGRRRQRGRGPAADPEPGGHLPGPATARRTFGQRRAE